jgi:arabinan endo-1,5-alpha-L-arabinosidase
LNGQFILYYSASSFGSQKSAIFLAKSSTGLPGSWSNEGLVTSTSSSNNYNAIDPNLIIDNGAWYLSLGSFWTGIKLIPLNSSTGKPSGSSVTALAQRTSGGGAVEASVIYKYGNYFYLFTSWDKCCSGTSSTYNIRVGRSSSVGGSYVDQAGVKLTSGGGTLVLSTHDNIIGPGGQDIMTDGDGPILIYHYYTSSGSYLGINKLDFSSGWPVVI